MSALFRTVYHHPMCDGGNAIIRTLAALLVGACFALLVLLVPLPAKSQPLPTNWSFANARSLLSYIEKVDSEGLDPDDYEPALLRSALEDGGASTIDAAATRSFSLLAHDFACGHVPAENRVAWHIGQETLAPEELAAMLQHGLATGDVPAILAQLLPVHAEYRALKAALARTSRKDQAIRERLRINLERWRWMPRDLGYRHLLVNVAAFQADLVDNARVLSRHRVIVGALKTPTPQFDATVNGVIFNPSWYVPQSIIAESVGRLVRTRPAEAARRGYVASRDQNGVLQVRQVPGPENALGQMKLDMPNPFTIYLHDTPGKALFERPVRAFSHGCVRTDRALELASALVAGQEGWDASRIADVLAARQTVRVALSNPVPVYIAYFTAVDDGKGGIAFLDDVYGRDAAVAHALNDRRNGDESAALFRKGLSECSGVRAG